MTANRLPAKLGKEPLIDVVCGVSFVSDIPADALLPGLLLSKLSGKQPKFEAMPAAQLPQIVRENDPNLRNAPLMRVVVDEQFSVLIGSKWLGVGCQMPYAGWSKFREMIQTVFSVLRDAPFIKGVDRHSLKYVDFLRNSDQKVSLARFNLSIEIAGQKLSEQVIQLRTEIASQPFLHAITIMSPASEQRLGGIVSQGALVDVDTHRVEKFSTTDFLSQLPRLLEEIHTANKSVFFGLLSDAGLSELEPRYD